MTNDERLVLRARQILGDPGVPRLTNAGALFKSLAESVRGDENESRRVSLLAEITDADVRERMRAALAEANA